MWLGILKGIGIGIGAVAIFNLARNGSKGGMVLGPVLRDGLTPPPHPSNNQPTQEKGPFYCYGYENMHKKKREIFMGNIE